MHDTLIVSLGSSVMTDDAIGHHVIQELQKAKIKAELIDLGMDLFRLRLFFSNHKKVIIIDALTGDYPTGTVLSFTYEELKEKLTAKIRNIHRMGSIEALEIMRLDDKELAAAEIFFVGIVVEKIDKGLELTEQVAEAIQEAITAVKKIL